MIWGKGSGGLNYTLTVLPPTHTFTHSTHVRHHKIHAKSSILFPFLEQENCRKGILNVSKLSRLIAGITLCKKSESDSPNFRPGKKFSPGMTKCCVCLFSVYACTCGGAVADVLGLKGFRPLAINLNSCEEKSPMIRKNCENSLALQRSDREG